MPVSDPDPRSHTHNRRFVLGFIAACSFDVLFYLIPIFIFAYLRWQAEMDLKLFLVFSGLFLLCWAMPVGWKWWRYTRWLKSGGADRSATSGGFQAGYDAAQKIH